MYSSPLDHLTITDGKLDNITKDYVDFVFRDEHYHSLTVDEAKQEESIFGVDLSTDLAEKNPWYCVCFTEARHHPSYTPRRIYWVVVTNDQLIEVRHYPEQTCGGLITRSPFVEYCRFPLVINIGENITWLSKCSCDEDGDEIIIPEELHPYHLLLKDYVPDEVVAYYAPKLFEELDAYLLMTCETPRDGTHYGDLFNVTMPIVTDNPDIALKKSKHQN